MLISRFSKFACLAALVAAVFASALIGSARAAGVACGDTLTQNTTLTADLTCPSGIGLIVSAGVAVDFAGHTLNGAGTGARGMSVLGGGARVSNGRIQGFVGEGVSEEGAATFENMMITGNGAGVANFPGFATIRNSSIVGNGGAALCCYVFQVIDSKILRNAEGISTVQGLSMSGSTVSGNGGHGIRARSGLSLLDNGVTLTGNDLANTDVSIFTTVDRITITNNRFVNSDLGITDGNSVTLSDNVFLNSNSPFASHTINVSPNSGYPTVSVARNRLINQTLVVTDPLVKVLDLGGNTGNRCGTLLVCGA